MPTAKPNQSDYVKAIIEDTELMEIYWRKSIVKTQQQLFLERLLARDTSFMNADEIADICCGGGTLSYHLANLNRKAKFSLTDAVEDALRISEELNFLHGDRFRYNKGDIYCLAAPDNKFDLTFCWQTLFTLESPEVALYELLRITRPGGKIFASTLVNINHDVDLITKVIDHTRPSAKKELVMTYATYSTSTFRAWLKNKSSFIDFHEFIPWEDIEFSGRGIGTFTRGSDLGRLQISAGMLMNWSIIEITK